MGPYYSESIVMLMPWLESFCIVATSSFMNLSQSSINSFQREGLLSISCLKVSVLWKSVEPSFVPWDPVLIWSCLSHCLDIQIIGSKWLWWTTSLAFQWILPFGNKHDSLLKGLLFHPFSFFNFNYIPKKMFAGVNLFLSFRSYFFWIYSKIAGCAKNLVFSPSNVVFINPQNFLVSLWAFVSSFCNVQRPNKTSAFI